VLGVGAFLVIYQEATAGIIIAGSILAGRALAPVDPRDCSLAEFCCIPAKLGAPEGPARTNFC
jgi:hypothetical protein